MLLIDLELVLNVKAGDWLFESVLVVSTSKEQVVVGRL